MVCCLNSIYEMYILYHFQALQKCMTNCMVASQLKMQITLSVLCLVALITAAYQVEIQWDSCIRAFIKYLLILPCLLQ